MDAMRTQKERGLGCGHGRSQQMRVIIIETVLMPRHGPRLSPSPYFFFICFPRKCLNGIEPTLFRRPCPSPLLKHFDWLIEDLPALANETYCLLIPRSPQFMINFPSDPIDLYGHKYRDGETSPRHLAIALYEL